jgi:hypothetical protein
VAELLDKFSDNSDTQISITTGIEHWDTGETTLSVSRNGRATVTNKRAGAETMYHGQLNEEQMKEFIAIISASDFVNIEPTAGLRKPDDVGVKIYLYEGDNIIQQNERLWYSDRHGDKQLNSIIMVYDKLVNELTDGKLPYG